MRYAALFVGLLGGILALLGTALGLTSAGVGGIFGVMHSTTAFWLSFAALLFALLGIAGAVLALTRPLLGGACMILAAIGGTLALTGAFFLGGILLIIGGVLALKAWREMTPHPVPVQKRR